MYLTANGRKLYYEVHGPETGQVVVFLHHGLGAVRSWKDQVPVLAEAGWRVVVYDRWGYGRSQPREKLDLPLFDEDVEDLRALLDHLQISCASLIGHSDGAATALYFTNRYPERVDKLVIVAAHIYVERKMEGGIRGLYQAFHNDQTFREKLQRIHGDKTEMIFNAWYYGWVNEGSLEWDMRPMLRTIPHRALVIQGEDDEHATPQHARDLTSSLLNAELWIEPGVAHMLPKEIPDEFNRRVLAFLEVRR
jgi:pimeloyl-ACP methyl ester carboxylesterase